MIKKLPIGHIFTEILKIIKIEKKVGEGQGQRQELSDKIDSKFYREFSLRTLSAK